MSEVFNVGDIVKVINDGRLYTTYSAMADDMQLTNWIHGRGYELGEEHLEGTLARVIAVRNHDEIDGPVLLGIRILDTNHEYIICTDGVEHTEVAIKGAQVMRTPRPRINEHLWMLLENGNNIRLRDVSFIESISTTGDIAAKCIVSGREVYISHRAYELMKEYFNLE